MNDFDDDLKLALRERASTVAFHGDLSGAAIRRARSIQRRRRIGGAVAAAALVAVGVPAGLQVGDAVSRGDQQIAPAEPDRQDDGDRGGDIVSSTVHVDLSALEPGDPPLVPYIDGSDLVVDGERVDLGVSAQELTYVTYAGDEVWYSVGVGREVTMRTTGDPGLVQQVTSGPYASTDGRYVAYVADGAVTVVDTEDGSQSTVDMGGPPYLQEFEVVGDQAYVIPANGRSLLRWTLGDTAATVVEGFVRPTAISPDGGLVADMVSLDDFGNCTIVKDLSGAPVWDRETCDYQVRGFSADGRFAWGVPARTDGYGPTGNVVLDATTGEVLMHVLGPEGNPAKVGQATFMQTAFETEAVLVMSVEHDDMAAIVRCDPATQGCTLATELVEGIAPYTAASPYALAAG